MLRSTDEVGPVSEGENVADSEKAKVPEAPPATDVLRPAPSTPSKVASTPSILREASPESPASQPTLQAIVVLRNETLPEPAAVETGSLVGEVTPETLLKQNSWIVWRGGVVEDFELVLDYRVSAQGNSGVGYRLAEVEGQRFAVRGPQADIHGGNMFTGTSHGSRPAPLPARCTDGWAG